MEFVINFTPPNYQAKDLHRQFHLISTVLVRKKNECKWRNLHHWQKFYTAAGTDGMDKFHLCSEDLHTLIHHLATSRVRVAGPQRGKRGQVRTEEAELAITTSFLRRTISLAGVRAQSKLLLSRLEVIGPTTGVAAAAGRRSLALNLERIVANQRRADLLSRLQGKALLRRGQFKTD